MILKQTKKILFTGLIIWYVAALFFVSLSTTFGDTELTATCLDTIAGYSSLCRSSVTVPNTDVMFKITKPDESVIRFSCPTNLEGVAKCDLNSFHTKKAGLYRVGAYLAGYEEPFPLQENMFRVYPDTISATTSRFTASKESVEANGIDESYLIVLLKDKYENPIPEHAIDVISSRIDDVIEDLGSTLTNEDGKVVFRVRSSTAGVSTFIAKDMYSNITLAERPKIVFYESRPDYTGYSPDSLKSDLIGSRPMGGGQATQLKLTIEPHVAPDKVYVNTAFNITVQALDSNGDPATPYRGTILFSTDDPNAKVPMDQTGYEFKGTDENASHTFSKATLFLSTGSHKLTVTDIDNPTLEDTKYITVIGKTTSNDNTNALPTTIIISSPTPNSTFPDTTISIIGTMSPNKAFKVLDTGMKLGTGTSDNDGNFMFEARSLSDGKHTFQVVAMDEEENDAEMSDEILVFINTKCAVLQDISFNPNANLTPNMPVEVTIVSEPKLSKARIIIDTSARDLTEDPDNPGTYKAKITTPAKAGEYPIRVGLQTAVGTECNPPVNKKLVITNQVVELPRITPKTSPGDKPGSVYLQWDALDDPSLIKGYTIYYDTNPLALKKKITSTSTDPNFTISGLEPGAMYYFAIAIVDNTGKEGSQGDIVPGTAAEAKAAEITNLKTKSEDSRIIFTWDDPKDDSISRYKFDYGLHSGEYLETAYTKDSSATWYIPDLINGVGYFFKLTGVDKDNNVVIASDEITATPGGETYHPSANCTPYDVQNVKIVIRGNQRILTWDNIPNIDAYRVYAGTKQGIFNLPTQQVRENYYMLPYLSDQFPSYYFAVKAVCADGRESINYSNVMKTGTNTIVIAGISLIVLLIVHRLLRKKKALSGKN